MRSLRLRKPSPALVIAVIALFVGLGGGAYAAKVGTNQLKAKSVTTGKIAGKAVTIRKDRRGRRLHPERSATRRSPLQAGVRGGHHDKLADEAVDH